MGDKFGNGYGSSNHAGRGQGVDYSSSFYQRHINGPSIEDPGYGGGITDADRANNWAESYLMAVTQKGSGHYD